MFSSKPSIPEVRESSTPNTLEHKEDNIAPLSLLSLPGEIMEALQPVIVSRELNLDELDPDQVNIPETWVPIDVKEQIKRANSVTTED